MTVRAPAVAGKFYPVHPEQLRGDIEGYLNRAVITQEKLPLGIIAPHAGYIFSAPIAAYGYKHCRGHSYKKVLIIAPSHFDGFEGLSIYPGSGLETPLGIVSISEKDREKLVTQEGVISSYQGYRLEHSLEVQLPFLQVVLKQGWKVIPLVMGYQHRETIDQASEILKNYINQDSLIVISSDLSHYYSYEQANEMDKTFCEKVQSRDLKELWNSYESGQVEACGFGPIFAFLMAIDDTSDLSIQVLDRRNSGDTAGPKDNVVGYCSIVCFWES